MIKKFSRIIASSQSNYNFSIIKKENNKKQCSYNLPIDLEDYLLRIEAVYIDYEDIKPQDNGKYIKYKLVDDYKMELGPNIIAIIGNEFQQLNNKVVFTHTEGKNGSSKKIQLKKTDFSNENDVAYSWFSKLYENNVENIDFVVYVDNENKNLKFDLELTKEMFSNQRQEFYDNTNDYDGKFSWIDFYIEFATKLLDYKLNRSELLDKFNKLFHIIEKKNPFVYNEEALVDMCPFTVFGTFNKPLTNENRINILSQIKEMFSINSNVPKDFYGIPVLPPQRAWFFKHEDGMMNSSNGTISLLWEFFEVAIKYSDAMTYDLEEKFIELFDKLVSIPLIKWNLTMGLFWIRPNFYINLDSKTRQYLSYLNLNEINYSEIFKSMINGQQYVDLLKYIRKCITDNIIDERSIYEISYNAWDYQSYSQIDDEEEENSPMVEYQFKSSINSGENKVVYGTPGCGKSYYVQNTLLNGYLEENVIRTTFYQDYTNTDFVGQILPVIESDKSVSYEFIPGPFSTALAKALEKPEEQVALVVEELNRGNAASIFGDIFQLLDRETKGDNKGRSIYSITNVNLQKHLTKELRFIFNKIMIPSNLSIYATMNTSDQNVFTLDTAFKRRWKFEKLSNKFEDYKELYGEEHPFKDDFIPGMIETWKDFVDTINNAILDEADITKSEDKQLGIFFVDETGLVKKELIDLDENKKEKAKEFAYKIFEYLWDDVLKYCHEKWFGKDVKSLDALIKKYLDNVDNNKGAEVFKNGIFDED